MTSRNGQFVYTLTALVLVISTSYFFLLQNIIPDTSIRKHKKHQQQKHFTILLYTRYFGRGWQDKYPLAEKTSVLSQTCSTLR